MDNSDVEEQSHSDAAHTDEIEVPARGRPVGKTDSTKRYRRTAAEISADKIQIAQMRLDALKQSEEQKLAATQLRKAARRKKPPPPVQESEIPVRKERPSQMPPPSQTAQTRKKATFREDSDSGDSSSVGATRYMSTREALYNSWFPSSPRTNHRFPF